MFKMLKIKDGDVEELVLIKEYKSQCILIPKRKLSLSDIN